ncbi:MAG: replicative DNA helicase [Capnocytophaga ochracea]|mgnify:CR=1 FL=1|jgi:dnaB-like helicase N terminal domain|uniref:replicative DNA helicase n=1 Tax=Capnocytophaga TaxID=1016 RepID=UPI0002A4026C|nr:MULTISPECIES: DnaB-like helicase C-terminal domain-containing protein [Capnocytophaga]EKY03787.1 replicative DNA helicase [Capnocytophaga sp. oral taxon 380 str. F0488]UZD36859.1 replicative DNA helicase [Capnocytophaga ochracea]
MKKTTDKNIEIEKMVLGALIVDSQAMAENHSLLNVNLFTTPEHQNIYKTIEEVWRRSHTVDLILLTARLTEKKIEAYTTYCIELTKIVSSSANIAFHIHLLIQNYIRRNFIENFSSLVEKAKEEATDVFELLDSAFNCIDHLYPNNQQTKKISELTEKFWESHQKTLSEKTMLSSLNIVNKVLGGWQKSNLSIVAGRPNMGKSAFFSQEIINIAEQNYSVGVFSLDMSNKKIVINFISNITRIPSNSIIKKELDELEYRILSNGIEKLEQMNVYIDDTPSISIEDLIKKAKIMKLEYNIDILFIDNLQLICYNKAPNREQEVSFIVRSLKDLAKELDIPIIVLSQLSRNVEQRIDKRPILSDLKDSGTIEEVADDVLFLYRPEHYDIDNWGKEYSFESTENQVEIIIAKSHHYVKKFSECCHIYMEKLSIENLSSEFVPIADPAMAFGVAPNKTEDNNEYEDIPY